MATAIKYIRDAAINAWDWPDIDSAKYRYRDRRRLRMRSQILSPILGVVTATYSITSGYMLSATLVFSAIGVLAGHYLAGVITELERRSRLH